MRNEITYMKDVPMNHSKYKLFRLSGKVDGITIDPVLNTDIIVEVKSRQKRFFDTIPMYLTHTHW